MIDPNKQYTQEEAQKAGIKIDLFGYPVIDKARNMRDMFLVPPFSVINTMDKEWQQRKKRWRKLIGDNGESREGTLMGKTKANDKSMVNRRVTSMNNGVSILDPCIAEIALKWFNIEGGKVFDPFAGDSVFGYVASYFNYEFSGIELRKEQAELNQKRLKDAGLKGVYYNDSSENIDLYIPDNSKDFMFSCPPYLDLEVYSDNPKDLSTMTHEEFFVMYGKILSKTYRKLKNNRFAVILVSDVRGTDGSYAGLIKRTIEIMEKAGYKYYNEIILVNPVGTLPLRAGRQMSKSRKVGRQHQNLLVFYKGTDQREIKKDFVELAPPNNYYDKK